jgi:hypothetical protein
MVLLIRFLAVLSALLSILACSRSTISSLFVAKSESEVDMLNLVEAPPGHLNGTFVVSSIDEGGTKKNDEIHNVTGSVYQDNVSLQIDNGILEHPTNIVGKFDGKTLSLTFGNNVVTFYRMSQKEYQNDLSVLENNGHNRQQVRMVESNIKSKLDDLKRLNDDLLSFVKWGNERIQHVNNVRAWYANRLAAYQNCLDTIRPFAVRRIDSSAWPLCAFNIRGDNYDRKEMVKQIANMREEVRERETILNREINTIPEKQANILHLKEAACALHEHKLPSKQEVDAYMNELSLEFENSQPLTEFMTILPKLHRAIDDDLEISMNGETKLSAISCELDGMYKSQLYNVNLKRGGLGIIIKEITPEYAASCLAPMTKGALIWDVVMDSPAEKGGIEKCDVIKSFDGKPVENIVTFLPLLEAMKPKVPVTVQAIRSGKLVTVEVAKP